MDVIFADYKFRATVWILNLFCFVWIGETKELLIECGAIPSNSTDKCIVANERSTCKFAQWNAHGAKRNFIRTHSLAKALGKMNILRHHVSLHLHNQLNVSSHSFLFSLTFYPSFFVSFLFAKTRPLFENATKDSIIRLHEKQLNAPVTFFYSLFRTDVRAVKNYSKIRSKQVVIWIT